MIFVFYYCYFCLIFMLLMLFTAFFYDFKILFIVKNSRYNLIYTKKADLNTILFQNEIKIHKILIIETLNKTKVALIFQGFIKFCEIKLKYLSQNKGALFLVDF